MPIGDFRPRKNWRHNRQFFYKYTTYDTAKAIVSGRKLRWSTPETLNDPFEARFDMPMELDQSIKSITLDRLWNMHYGDGVPGTQNRLGQIIASMRGVFPKLSREEFDAEFGASLDEGLAAIRAAMPKLQSDLREHMRTSKYLCLSESSDNLLLWAHYAAGHTGACFELQCVPDLDSAWGGAQPIEYVDDVPLFADKDTVSRVLSGEASFDHRRVLDRLVYSKSTHWAYEREWRVFSGDGRDKAAPFEDIPFALAELSSVTLGLSMSATNRAELAKLIRENFPGADIRVAQRAAGRFAIDSVPYTA